MNTIQQYPFTKEEITFLERRKQTLTFLSMIEEDIKTAIQNFIVGKVYPRLNLKNCESSYNLNTWMLEVKKEEAKVPEQKINK